MFQGCHCRVLESDSMAWKRPSTTLEQLAKVLHCIVMASKGFVKALPTTTADDLHGDSQELLRRQLFFIGLEQEKYLLQAFSREKALAPRALIMARVQAPRSYVRDRQFGSGVFKKIWFNRIPWSHQKGH